MITTPKTISNTNLQRVARTRWQHCLICLFSLLVLFIALPTSSVDASARNQGAAIVNEFPTDNQLYPRDRNSNLATVAISGVAESAVTEVELNVLRNGASWQTINRPIAGSRAYNISIQIPAELASYDLELLGNRADGSQTELASAANVVAGDIFVINGQSNAESGAYTSSDGIDVSDFVRTYGWWQADNWEDDDRWYIPIADCSGSPRCVGQWGLRFGANIVNAEQIPVAIINGAKGGEPIGHFQRNDANPTDLSTNYGRLLTRLTSGNIKESIRAIMWYQGESDGGNYTGHINGFTELFQDWAENYPSVERYYVFQLRSGCGSDLLSETSNAQREFALQRANVTAMSTTGLDGHDGCHYAYVDGYQKIGDNMARTIRRDLYNQPLQDADAANILSANSSGTYTVDITFTPNNNLVADNNFVALFELRNEETNQVIPINDGVILSNTSIRVTTSQQIPNDSTLSISYLSPSGDQNWLTNQAGIGILSFLRFPVETIALGDVNCDGTVSSVDALFVLQYIVLLRDDTGACPQAEQNGLYTAVGDVDNSGEITSVDALFILQCDAQISNSLCPDANGAANGVAALDDARAAAASQAQEMLTEADLWSQFDVRQLGVRRFDVRIFAPLIP